MGGTGVLILAHSAPGAVYALAVIAASAVTLTRPAQAALLSSLVEHPDELTAATAVSGWVESASALGGPALAGVLIVIDGSGLVFVVFAAAVAVSLALVSRLGPVQARVAGDVSEAEQDEEDEGVLAGLRIGDRVGAGVRRARRRAQRPRGVHPPAGGRPVSGGG